MKTALVIVVIAALFAGGYYFYTGRANESTKNSEMLAGSNSLEIITENVSYIDGANGFYARPKNEGTYPGVVMIHEWWGLNDNIKDMARQLAGEGYQVLAVDMYQGRVATVREDAQKYRGELTQEYSDANLKAAADYLRSKGAVRLASLGWCFGGGKSLELALSGQKLDATVIYYGSLVTDRERLQRISWPVLGIFGETDQSIPVAQVNEFQNTLTALGIPNSVHIYPGVGHAFANPSGANYAPEPTRDAWQKTLSFLDENLKK